MPRAASGTIYTRTLSDGTRAYRLRFSVDGKREIVTLHERAGCECGCGGAWDDQSARTELGNIRARVRAGVWVRRRPSSEREPEPTPITFHEYASQWLHAKKEGVLSEKPLAASSYSDYHWQLSCHLLPFFGTYPLGKIDDRAVPEL